MIPAVLSLRLVALDTYNTLLTDTVGWFGLVFGFIGLAWTRRGRLQRPCVWRGSIVNSANGKGLHTSRIQAEPCRSALNSSKWRAQGLQASPKNELHQSSSPGGPKRRSGPPQLTVKQRAPDSPILTFLQGVLTCVIKAYRSYTTWV